MTDLQDRTTKLLTRITADRVWTHRALQMTMVLIGAQLARGENQAAQLRMRKNLSMLEKSARNVEEDLPKDQNIKSVETVTV